MVKSLREYSKDLIVTLESLDAKYINCVENVIERTVSCLKKGGKVMLAGNGGSAADAQHMAGEYVSRFMFDRPGLSAVALTTDTSILTAIGNDYGYDKLFTRQIEAIGRAGDVLMLYTTSGTSPNIVAAIEVACSMDITVVLLTSEKYVGHEHEDLLVLKVPNRSTPTVQEMHLVTGHYICMRVESAIYG